MISIVNLPVPIFLAFREGLEATLIIVILLLYLKNTKQNKYNKYVYIGSLLAIVLSILFAFAFTFFFGGFTGTTEQIFEGTTFVISGIFIITLILWIGKEGPKMKENLEQKLEESIQKQKVFSILERGNRTCSPLSRCYFGWILESIRCCYWFNYWISDINFNWFIHLLWSAFYQYYKIP